jgi:glycerate 2-kinase
MDRVIMNQYQEDAIEIWQAAVDAVQPARLIPGALWVDGSHLVIGAHRRKLESIDRIEIVGGGKAVDGMAAATLTALAGLPLQLSGWINAIDEHSRRFSHEETVVHRHAARPAGVNEPTPAAVKGSLEILRRVSALGTRDICLCLLSGGGSAMLTAPSNGVTLNDKIDVIRRLSAGGADIEQLNSVRRCLSRIKGGGLARQCRAGDLFTLIISDVLGDAIESIASGPTALDSADPQVALDVLAEFSDRHWQPTTAVMNHLRAALKEKQTTTKPTPEARVHHILLANIHTAMAAAADEARRRGYCVKTVPVAPVQPDANTAGEWLADQCLTMPTDQRTCIVSGGEPTVRLVSAPLRGTGGRNQQLALAALRRLVQRSVDPARGFAFLSAGTDGEDGPTDAAGAIFGANLLPTAIRHLAAIETCLAKNDAYSFFDVRGCLLKTGPTGTNVGDLRVILIGERLGP